MATPKIQIEMLVERLSKNPRLDILAGRVRIDGKLIRGPKYRLNPEYNGTRILSVRQDDGTIKTTTI